MSYLIYLLERAIMEELKQEKPKKGGAEEMETRPVIETVPRKEVRDEAVARVLADPSRNFTEKMDAVNNLFKRGKIPFEVFYETISDLAEKNAEIEKIKRDIAAKEKSLALDNSGIKELQEQELLIRRMLNQDTLSALREVINRSVSEAATLEDAEALLTAGIAEIVIRHAAQPEKGVEGLLTKERRELIAQDDERVQKLNQEIRRDAELKRLERLHQKAVEHVPALAKSVEEVDKSEVLSILDDYFLTEKQQLAELGLTEPEIMFIRKRAVSLLKEWLTVWKDALSEEDKNEVRERISRLQMEVVRRTLMETLQ